eukprot:2487030-Heterocapsa_arctica.AAC.1
MRIPHAAGAPEGDPPAQVRPGGRLHRQPTAAHGASRHPPSTTRASTSRMRTSSMRTTRGA